MSPKSIASLVAIASFVTHAGAASPANDDFADAVDLGTTNTATTGGSNIESDTEFGEPSPSANPDVDVFSTAWWAFQVPANGFVEISTAGSDFDTILGVYVGTDLISLIEVGSDNDSGPGTTSEVTVFALAGQNYRIQVSGFAADEGSIALSISPGTPPTPPTLTSITLQPSPVDVTAADGTVTATVQIDSPDGFDYGEISIFDPNGVAAPTGGLFDVGSRIAGDEFSGTYAIPLAISTYGAPGTYRAELGLYEDNGDTARYGEGGAAWPPGSSGTFDVVNNGTIDLTPPSMTSFSATPDTADVTAGPVTLAARVAASDDLGIQYVVVDVHDPDDFFLFSALATLTTGTNANGTWQTNIPIARGSISGTWRLNARAIDFSGKTSNYQPIDTEDLVTVMNAATVDEDPPVLVHLGFSPNPVVRGNPVTVTIDFTDDLSGLAEIPSNLYLDFHSATGALQFSDPFSLADLIAGNSAAGVLEYPTFIQPTAPVGVWDTAIHLQDGAGSAATYSNLNPGGGAFPYPAGTTGQLNVVESGGTAQQLWLARYPSLSGPNASPLADPDKDGWSNLLELVFDGDPTKPIAEDPKAANFPTTLITPTELKIRFQLSLANLNGTEGDPIEVKGRATGDLQTHTEIPLTDLGGGMYEASVPIGASERQFLSLEVVDPNS